MIILFTCSGVTFPCCCVTQLEITGMVDAADAAAAGLTSPSTARLIPLAANAWSCAAAALSDSDCSLLSDAIHLASIAVSLATFSAAARRALLAAWSTASVTASTRDIADSASVLVLSAFVTGIGLASSPGEESLARDTADSKSHTFITVSKTADGSCGGSANAPEDDCSSPVVPCAAWCRSAAALSSAVCRDMHAHVCAVGQ